MTNKPTYNASYNLLRGRLGLLYNAFLEAKDGTRAKKVYEVFLKLHHHQVALCFTGHFSAGKSSMMNELIGEDLLASSPIPTSANLVTIKHGEKMAILTDNHGNKSAIKPPFQLDQLHAFTKNGEEIRRIDLTYPKVPEQIIYMDTPGIDSTDQAHALATEDALYLADAIFYMVDYNHVQSSSNFQYLKELSAYEKPIFLIVNQIDKHNQNEIDLESFKEQVGTSLSHWSISVNHVFYTSLRRTNVSNDLDALKRLITQMSKEQNPTEHIHKTLKSLIQEHIEWLSNQSATRLEDLEEKALPYQVQDLPDFNEKKTELEKAIEKHRKKPEDWVAEIRNKLSQTVKSSILMPYETRELARKYLESQEAGFKVGGLFSSKKKTQEEKSNRLLAFIKAVQTNSDTLLHHLRETLNQAINELRLSHYQQLIDQVYQLKLAITKDLIESVYNEGARATGQYILNFTEDLARLIQKQSLQLVNPLLASTKEAMFEDYKEEITELEKELETIEKTRSLLEKIQQELNHEKAIKEKLLLFIEGSSEFLPDYDYSVGQLLKTVSLEQDIPIKIVEEELVSSKTTLSNKEDKDKSQDKGVTISDQDSESIKQKQEFLSNTLEQAAKVLEDLHGFRRIAEQLSYKAKRLTQNNFVIALFGAFSAGKSSFANALLGDLVLPVSPHPTTATINQVLPVTSENPHGTVIVQLKNEQALNHELSLSGKKLGITIDSMDTLKQKWGQVNPERLSPTQRLHFSFLKAAQEGYSTLSYNLGKSLKLTLQNCHDYIAQEKTACFVESVSIFYDCSMTREGVILVDTPGADSINARHTDVAFEYIKNSDAIIYVTYYNHAFSRADKEFLRQLGRVKDTFSLDKMFFVINAIDLAQSDQEKQDVITYMEEQLQGFGIRRPRLYGISSLLSLYSNLGMSNSLTESQATHYHDIKQSKALLKTSEQEIHQYSGMPHFKKDWFDFRRTELVETALSANKKELEVVLDTLSDMLDSAQLEEEERDQRLQQLKDDYQRAQKELNELKSDHLLQALTEQLEELIFYVKKRLMIRYYEEFKAFFNPADLQDNKREAKVALMTCLNEFIDFLAFDLDQETKATELRIEAFIKEQLQELGQRLLERLRKLNPRFHFSVDKEVVLSSPTYEIPVPDDPHLFEVLKLYKNPKQFFEGKGQEEMRNALEPHIGKWIDHVAEQLSKVLLDSYIASGKIEFNALVQFIQNEITEHFEAEQEVLSEAPDPSTLYQSHDKIKNLLRKLS